jgi:hypothetical protein
MKRAAAFLAGLCAIVMAILLTLGCALVALLALAVAVRVQHRRGRRLRAVPALWVAVIATTVAVLAGFGLLVWRDPTIRASAHAGFAATQQPQPPPEVPTFLRGLPGANVPPPPLPPSVAVVLGIFSLFLGGQLYGGLFGALTWGGVWLLRYGVRGPELPIEESALLVE